MTDKKPMLDLLPCPFCKSKDYDPVCDQNDNGSCFVGCLAHQEGGCGVHMGDFTKKEHAKKAWNTRTDLCAKDDALPNALALIEEMAEALQFYADDSEYLSDQGMWDMATSPIDRDRGRKAADTLTRYETFKADVTAKAGG